jgi:hypothetical protein
MLATTMSAGGVAILTLQTSLNARGAFFTMAVSVNSPVMPLLLGGATTFRARMEETQAVSRPAARQTVRIFSRDMATIRSLRG